MTTNAALQIEAAEDRYNDFCRDNQQTIGPGHPELAIATKLADDLRRLYDANGVDDFDRVSL